LYLMGREAGRLPPWRVPQKSKAGAGTTVACWLRNIVSFFTQAE